MLVCCVFRRCGRRSGRCFLRVVGLVGGFVRGGRVGIDGVGGARGGMECG